MKKILLMLGLAFVVHLCAVEFVADRTHSSVEFRAKHLLVSNVGGSFKNFSGRADIDPKSKQVAFLEGEISIASIDTSNSARDDHLRSPDFFNVSKHAKAYFKMSRQEEDKIYGVLTLNGVSKEIELDIDVSDMIIHPKTKKNVIALELKGAINRKDFGIGMNTPSSVVGDEIKLVINLEMLGK